MKIGRIRDEMAAGRIRDSRANFAQAADYVRDHPPPEAVDGVVWAMHGAACREMVAEMDEALADWEMRERIQRQAEGRADV